jgi:catechol 2,3-dioxygenase-like lactoylglutathione lyase family enzyme
MGTVISIDGPIVSTQDMARQRLLFESVLGMRSVAEEHLDAARVEALFGLRDTTAEQVLLETPGTQIGVQLLQFSPGSETVIREGGVGVASDALKMIGFFTHDSAAANARFREFGFDLVTAGATMELPDGARFIETHVRGPDGVMVAAIYPENRDASSFVTIADRLFSEIQSSYGPVSDFEPVRHFYEQALGVPMGFKYEFVSSSFSQMIGAGQITTIRANNYGRVVEDVMLGIIHYGLPAGSTPTLRERARPPHRGIVGVRLRVSGLEAVVKRCADAGFEIVGPVAGLALAPYGSVRTATLRGPHGVWHQLRESSAERN